jgi:hypothetical protein
MRIRSGAPSRSAFFPNDRITSEGDLGMDCWIRMQTVAVYATAVLTLLGAIPSAQSRGLERQSIDIDALQVVAEERLVTNISSEATGFTLIAKGAGPQVAVLATAGALVACVRQDETAEVRVPLAGRSGTFSVSARVDLLEGETAHVELSIDGKSCGGTLRAGQEILLSLEVVAADSQSQVCLIARGDAAEAAVRWRELRIEEGADAAPAVVGFQAKDPLHVACPPPRHPPLRLAMEQVLIEWDWRMQDGISTSRDAVSYAAAVQRTFERGDLLIGDLLGRGHRMEGELVE